VAHPQVVALDVCPRCGQLICALCAEERPTGFVCRRACRGPQWTLKRKAEAKRKSWVGVLAVSVLAGIASLVLVYLITSSLSPPHSRESDQSRHDQLATEAE
jgi:hypothetical protein